MEEQNKNLTQSSDSKGYRPNDSLDVNSTPIDPSSIYPTPLDKENISQVNNPEHSVSNSSRWFKYIVILIVLILVAVGSYLVLQKTKKSQNKVTVSSSTTKKSPIQPSDHLTSYAYDNNQGQKFKLNFYKDSVSLSTAGLALPHPRTPNYQALLSPVQSKKKYPLWIFISGDTYFPTAAKAKAFYSTLDNCVVTAFKVSIASLNEETSVCSTPDSYYYGVTYNMPFYSGNSVYQATIGENQTPDMGSPDLQNYNSEIMPILSSIEITN